MHFLWHTRYRAVLTVCNTADNRQPHRARLNVPKEREHRSKETHGESVDRPLRKKQRTARGIHIRCSLRPTRVWLISLTSPHVRSISYITDLWEVADKHVVYRQPERSARCARQNKLCALESSAASCSEP